MGLCGTGIYANDVLCEVIDNLDNLIATAEAAKADAEDAITDLKSYTETVIPGLADINYAANTSGVNKTYVAPSTPSEPDYSSDKPTSPTIPSSSTPLISSSTIDDRWNDAASKLSRVATKRERDAVYRASSMGLGMASSALTIALRRAEEEANKEAANKALTANIQYADWLREDAKFVHDLAQKGYANDIQSEQARRGAETQRLNALVAEMQAQIASEGERRGWSQMQINDLLEQADKATGYALEKAKILADLTKDTNEAVAQLTTGLAQAIYAAANFNLTGSGNQSVNESISS